MTKIALAFKGRFLDSYTIEKEETLIGRDPACEIAIDSLAVASKHACILYKDDRYQVLALDEDYPLLLNHTPVSDALLEHGDILQVGKHTLTFSESTTAVGFLPDQPEKAEVSADSREPDDSQDEDDLEASEATSSQEKALQFFEESASNKAYLQILNGSKIGRIVSLYRPLTRLGKSGSLSAVIVHRNDGYYLSHLEGEGIPLVNDCPIGDQSQHLREGNIIQIGHTRMLFCEKMKSS